MADPPKDLPRLGNDSLGPCAFCKRGMAETGLPIFYRFTVRHCGIDGNSLREQAGLAMMLGGGEAGAALSGVLGPRTKHVVEINKGEINVCMSCAQEHIDVVTLAGYALEGEDG